MLTLKRVSVSGAAEERVVGRLLRAGAAGSAGGASSSLDGMSTTAGGGLGCRCTRWGQLCCLAAPLAAGRALWRVHAQASSQAAAGLIARHCCCAARSAASWPALHRGRAPTLSPVSGCLSEGAM